MTTNWIFSVYSDTVSDFYFLLAIEVLDLAFRPYKLADVCMRTKIANLVLQGLYIINPEDFRAKANILRITAASILCSA